MAEAGVGGEVHNLEIEGIRGHVEVGYWPSPAGDPELIVDVVCTDGPLMIEAIELTGGELQVRLRRDWNR